MADCDHNCESCAQNGNCSSQIQKAQMNDR